MVFLLLTTISTVEAKKVDKRITEKAERLNQKIDSLLYVCENAGVTVSYAYCFSKGYQIYKDRLYVYVDAGQKLNLEYKMYFWSKQL